MFKSMKIYHKKYRSFKKKNKFKRKKQKAIKSCKIESIQAKEKKEFLKQRSIELNQNLPKSEVWFQELYQQYKDENDLFNHPYHGKIPDVINKKYRYIIEIDGSIHDTIEQIIKDKEKNKIFISGKYCVFRIKAFLLRSFEKIIKYILFIRESKLNHKIMLDWQRLNKTSFNAL